MNEKMKGKIGVMTVLGLLLFVSLTPIVSAEDKGEKIFEDNALLTKKAYTEKFIGDFNESQKLTFKIEAHDPYNTVNISLRHWDDDKEVDKKTDILNETYTVTVSPGKYYLYVEEVGNYSDKPISERGANVYITVWAKDTGVINNGDTPGFLVSALLLAVPLSMSLAILEREKRKEKE